MSEIIAPSVAARLRFFVTDPTTGVGVTGLTHSTITTAGYATETNGVRSSVTSITLTSTAAVTAALATGQVIEYGLGQYGIDVPAVGTSGLIFAVVTVTGKEIRAVRYQIKEAAELNTAGQAMVTAFNAMRVGNVFTAPALANAPTGSGGGDNTEVLAAIDSMKSIIAQWVALNIPSDVRGFPATIIGGTDVTVTLEVVDSNNDPITEIFGESVETVQWLFGMGTSARRARILGSVEWISDLLQITITRAETLDDDDGPRTWMIGCKLTSGEVKWVKTGVTRLIGRQFAEPTTTTTGA